ncbi:teashirt homolog 1 [Orycteropus afer afer]|uniref:Teashirt homolog 1 n=1 Tax=Orycteropus afer afer TaxID=1230840 RepID=A0A8B7ATQ5_ORYAF|nr:teashirt homolog 1 [Orycteropus afer afer]
MTVQSQRGGGDGKLWGEQVSFRPWQFGVVLFLKPQGQRVWTWVDLGGLVPGQLAEKQTNSWGGRVLGLLAFSDCLLLSLPAYVPEEELKAAEREEEAGQEDGLPVDIQDSDFLCNEEAEIKEAQSYQNSPVSTATNQDAGYGSPFSEGSDQLAHFKLPSSREEKDDAPSRDTVSYPQDSLAQIKAVYANLFSESCWSSLALDLKKSGVTTSNSDASQKDSTPAPTPPTATSTASTNTHTPNTSTGASHSGGTSNSSSGYDWHQAALAKTLQQTSSYGLLPEPSLFSTVQLYRQNNKLYGSVFTGASKFRCKDCSAAYDTLVELTVHMNETGHYRDDNRDKDAEKTKRWSKPRKRSLMEMEGKEDAQKVLKCMYCGHSFESLQDLSVHMIKTKHYQKVPLKEPVPAITKLVPSTKKRALQDLASPCSPEPAGVAADVALSESGKDQKTANPYVTPNNRYGYQNGASYTWQFEARKAQILKCMECGSSHDTLQQLTAHMMVTGHFLKVTTSASKKGKQLVLDPVVEEKIQSIPLPPTTHTRLPAAGIKQQPDSPAGSATSEEKKEPDKEKAPISAGEADRKIKEESEDGTEKFEPTTLYQYLREEDLDDSPKGGVDILKSLENTVTTAISKAQNGAPSWGGYPSIHAAYQLPGSVKPLPPAVQSVHVQPSYVGGVKSLSSEHSALLHSPGSLTPPPLRSNVSAMEELVEKVTGKISVKKEDRPVAEKEKGSPAKSVSPVAKENKDLPKAEEASGKQASRRSPDAEAGKAKREGPGDAHTPNGTEPLKAKVTNGCSALGIITDHSPEPPFINPLSALQSIMNAHLGKVSKPASPSLDPLAMLYRISNSVLDRPAQPGGPGKQADAIDHYYCESSDQPIDLTKSKSKPLASGVADAVSSPLRESALMDISDMVKNLTGRLTPKSSTPSTVSEKSDADGSSFEEALDELSPVHKRKGRQSNWNPQHLLILQAQFASSLRETPEGKYIMSDLGPQERVHISKFTGLSMTTISHWLANVKYQLRRTGGTKFLKSLDTGHPVFFCSDCASQFRTASTYISHLETHLGFSLKDLSKLPLSQIQEQQNVSKVLAGKPLGPLGAADEDLGSTFQCKLCNRTFASKHAVKLHLSKTHGKSPEDHLIYVTELEKQ